MTRPTAATTPKQDVTDLKNASVLPCGRNKVTAASGGLDNVLSVGIVMLIFGDHPRLHSPVSHWVSGASLLDLGSD